MVIWVINTCSKSVILKQWVIGDEGTGGDALPSSNVASEIVLHCLPLL